jgi:hypothetical protein
MFLRSLVDVIVDLIARRWVGIAHPFFLQEKFSVELRLGDMLDKSYFEL